jgi:hypothetical protein
VNRRACRTKGFMSSSDDGYWPRLPSGMRDRSRLCWGRPVSSRGRAFGATRTQELLLLSQFRRAARPP